MAQRTKTVKVSAGGRIVIPAAFRKELGLKPGDSLGLVLEGGSLRLLTRRQRIQRALDNLSEQVKGGPSMADELIAERHAEAAREDEELERWKSGQRAIE